MLLRKQIEGKVFHYPPTSCRPYSLPVYITCLCYRVLIEAHSAEAAIQQAKGAGSLAVWSKEKVILQSVGGLAESKEGNRSRDLARQLHKRGFMLNVPISWLRNAF